ncbi:MAG: histidine phosphatase family protein [Propionibacteriaceae bacterium]|nr:histidine phosphatase family protein [Propionibacteriaceae bacterium]
MITLLLMRHAKSDWSAAGLTDHDRPLNARGERDAPTMAKRLADAGVRPEIILTSTAVRARMTAEAQSTALGCELTLVPTLYGASASTLMSHAARSGARTVMIVAHDPGMTDLTGDLSEGGISHMPTAAIATFTWQTDDWNTAITVQPDSWSLDTPR